MKELMYCLFIAACSLIVFDTAWDYLVKRDFENAKKRGVDEKPLTDTFRVTYVHEESFESGRYKTFEKIGTKVWIMQPDTIKRNPLLLSDWKVTIEGNPRQTFRNGDWDKIPVEIQSLFWFKPN